jgi:SAM-dependent methyltransferase
MLSGDFDYDTHGSGYASVRRPDPRIAALVHAALGDARTVLNVGAGAGSYEPDDRHVVAVEPSATMRAQRPPSLAPALNAAAEHLPFDDNSFDAVMATVTVHQWRVLPRGRRASSIRACGRRSRRGVSSHRKRPNAPSPPCAETWPPAGGIRRTANGALARISTVRSA